MIVIKSRTLAVDITSQTWQTVVDFCDNLILTSREGLEGYNTSERQSDTLRGQIEAAKMILRIPADLAASAEVGMPPPWSRDDR